jgi:DNA-directed RNA polymerase specialized sigma24 family protein
MLRAGRQPLPDAVFGVVLSRLRNFHDAEDLTQATFLEAFQGLERLRDPGRLPAAQAHASHPRKRRCFPSR